MCRPLCSECVVSLLLISVSLRNGTEHPRSGLLVRVQSKDKMLCSDQKDFLGLLQIQPESNEFVSHFTMH